jgi:NAD-reducing hydrogenase large subunit
MPTARDFQPVLIGQRMEDLPKIVARICGICPIAHRLGAIKAIEDILEIVVPKNAQVLREIALLGEIIRSHIYSVFFCTLPDLLGLAEQLKRHDILGLQDSHPRLFSIGLRTYRDSGNLIDAIAGDMNMATRIVPGGMFQNISGENQVEIVKDLHSMLSSIQWAKSQYRSLLSQVRGDLDVFNLPSPIFVTSFDTQENRFTGLDDVMLITPDGESATFPAVQFPKELSEHHDPDAPTRLTYSSGAFPDSHLLTGPHARIAALQVSSAGSTRPEIGLPNLFHAGLLRLDEIEFCMTRIISLLESKWRDNEDIFLSWDPKSGTAGSAVEAPRGTLLYRISIDGRRKVSGIQIRVPTELNAGSLTYLVSQVVNNCIELGWSAEKSIEWAKMAVRCFDPCVSCATNTQIRFHE